LDAAFGDGKTLCEQSYDLGDELDGCVGMHRFLGLYVVSETKGEEQNFWGPFASRKEADHIFVRVDVLYMN
jgi:hypothetical protein